ncbi:MAG TPA: ABC transporter substrate-binding protein [Baekduia sp.]|uniref:ABC transporter substrate-binding protein n=1 Tax=Baekduia sp. TaxID=2600305 RepID=UPI002D7727F5|nr:ABC transporter substrate-binding protein [Baekduia sp.]HET6505287.1 ABC transporter substrate-binding protein [Baekduia sp.]
MRRAIVVACAALAVVPLAGCGSKKAPGGTGASGSAGSGTTADASTANGPKDATLTYLDSNELMVGWDPATSYSNEVSVMNNMYEQLVRYDKDTKQVEPQLADSYTKSSDGKSWTFKLHPGVKFHNGHAADAPAAKAAIERTMKLNQGAAYEWGAVKKITAPDATTLKFQLKYPAPLDLIASSAYAAYVYDTKAAPSGTTLAKWFAAGHEAGTGPYQLAQWNKGADVEVRLKQFSGYWKGWDGTHYANVVYRHVPQATTSAQLLRSGDATIARQLNAQLFDNVKSAPGMTSSTTPSFENLVGLLNTASGPLKDKRVRQAVIKTMDYSGLIQALKGAGQEAHGFIPEGLAGYDPSITEQQDLDGAKALLKEAGYGDGGKKLTLTLTHAQGDDNESLTAAVLKSDLAKVGVDVKVKPMQWTAQWDQAKSSDASKRQDIFVMYWYPDYADAFSWFTSLFRSSDEPAFNLSYVKDAQLDSEIDALQEKAAQGGDTAQTAYADAQKRVLDDAVVMTFFVNTYQRPFRKSLTKYVDNPAYSNVVFAYDVVPGAES